MPILYHIILLHIWIKFNILFGIAQGIVMSELFKVSKVGVSRKLEELILYASNLRTGLKHFISYINAIFFHQISC